MSTKPDYEAALRTFTNRYEGGAVSTRELVRQTVNAALGDDPTAFAVAALIAEGTLTEELATAHWSALTAEERSAMLPNIRRYVTAWEPIPAEKP